MRPEREQDRDERAEPERPGQPAPSLADQHGEARDREQRREPAEEDEALAPVPLVPRDEVEPLRRVERDGAERAPAGADRARDRDVLDEQPGGGADEDGGGSGERSPAAPATGRGVEAEERDRAEREVHLAGERDRRHRGDGQREPAGRPRRRPRSNAQSASGSISEIGPSRWPALWIVR